MLEKKHHEFRERVRAFADENIAPDATVLDIAQRFPTEYLQPLARAGLMTMIIPEAYGGRPVDTVSYSIAVEEVSRVCGSTGITVAAHNSLGTFPIVAFGNEEQKKKYLPPVSEGGLLAFGLTEPEAGSDAGATKSYAEKRNGHWVFNGTKCFITSATHAFATIATAKTTTDPKDKAITSFILEKGQPGYSVGKKENKMGLRASDTASLHFDDMAVPDENLLGNIGEGFKQMLITLDGGRISIGAMAIGLAQGAYECVLKYAADTIRDGKPVASHQSIQFKLADMATEIEAARLMVYHASKMKDSGAPYSRYSAMCKLFASEVGTRTTANAIGIMAEAGFYTGPHPVERMWRDVKLCEIGEGTSEIQRLVIARDLLQSVKGK